MTLETLLPFLSTLVAVVGFVLSNMRSARAHIERQKARDIENATQLEHLLSLMNNLASREYLDERLKEELKNVESAVKIQIDDLKNDMKEQMNDLKRDIKAQQEVTQGMSKDVVSAVKGADFAHKRIDSLDKRLDDLKELALSQKKA